MVVSIDFIKSDRHRDEFLRSCGDFVIVDEVHQAASGATRGRQQRHDLLKRLAADTDRHLVLVSATPHSGDDDAFRSLLTLLDPDFAQLPANLSGRENEAQRRRVAAHLVQRRRGDIRRYLDEDTSFPEREDADATYRLTEAYREFLRDVWAFARERVDRPGTDTHQARVRWWSALSLLRACGSSPAAATALGISVPVPVDSNEVMEALLAAMLEFDWDAVDQLAFDLDETAKALDAAWENAADHETRSRSLFAQHTIDVDEVGEVLDEMRAAIGSPAEVEAFVRDAAVAAGATVEARPAGVTRIDLAEAPPSLRDRVGRDTPAGFEARFDLPVADGVEYLSRTHPVTTGLAQWVLDSALDADAAQRPAVRAGVTRTRDVTTATTLLLLRLRHHITLRRERREQRSLAEEAALVAFTASPSAPQWIDEDEVEALLSAVPHANVTAELARKTLTRLVSAREVLDADLATFAAGHAHALAGQHARLRTAAAARGHVTVEANLPVDVLGMWVLLPVPT